jgi:hypothetical protein
MLDATLAGIRRDDNHIQPAFIIAGTSRGARSAPHCADIARVKR